jgi:hypothetical protein
MSGSREKSVPQMHWSLLGRGSCNKVYHNQDEVFKHQIKLDFDTSPSQAKTIWSLDAVERSLRIWGEINPEMHAQSQTIYFEGEEMQGWTCPYIKGTFASDKDISQTLIDIFNRSGRVVIDAANDNFITDDKKKTTCIDIGVAFKLGTEKVGSTTRKKSQASFDAWELFKKSYNTDVFPLSSIVHPKTVKTIKSLLFIMLNFPEMTQLNFLKTNPVLIEDCAQAYDRDKDDKEEEEAKIEYTLDEESEEPIGKPVMLETKSDVTKKSLQFNPLKQNCIAEIKKYITLRESSSSLTKFFQKTSLTALKVKEATNLIDLIGQAKSFVELDNIFIRIRLTSQMPNNTLFAGSWFTSEFAKSIGKCKMLTDKFRKNPDIQADKSSDASLRV